MTNASAAATAALAGGTMQSGVVRRESCTWASVRFPMAAGTWWAALQALGLFSL